MPQLEALRENDEALHEMHRSDIQKSKPLSPEDVQAYKELIEEQRSGFQATQFEKKNQDGVVTSEIAPSIGDAALHNSLTPVQAQRAQFESAAEDWHNPKS